MHPPGQDAPTVVIGAGLAGLSAAVRLARAGRRVTVVEASAKHGGCCSTAEVEGFRFNNGAVYVAVPSLLRKAFGDLGLDFDAEVPLAPIHRPLESHTDDGSVVHLVDAASSLVEGRDGERRTRMLRQGLAALQADWAPIYRVLVDQVLPAGPSPWNALRRLGPYLPRLRGSAASLIRRYFPDAALQDALGSLLLYTGVPPERLPSAQVIGLLALLEEGFHLPVRGMGAISDALLRGAIAAGVEVRLGQRVERIDLTGGAVSGVVVADDERIAASSIFSTVSGFEVEARLLPPAAAPRRLSRAARRAPLSHRAIAIQVGGSGPTDDGAFIVNHVPPLERQGLMHHSPARPPDWLSYTVPTRVLPGLAPTGNVVIECYAPASGIRHVAEWTRQQTADTVGLLLEGLRRRLPDLSVDTLRVIDPVDFHQRHHLYEGALYGVSPGAPPHRLFPRRPGIEGLYLAGQTTFPGYGVAPATLSGIQAADALLHDSGHRKRGWWRR